MAVQRLQGKAAGVDFPAFGHKLRQLIGVVLMAWESFGAEGGEPALHAEHHPRAVQQDGGGETFALQTGGLQHIDEADRTFESDGVERHQRLLPRLGFYVLKDFLFIIDQEITGLVGW